MIAEFGQLFLLFSLLLSGLLLLPKSCFKLNSYYIACTLPFCVFSCVICLGASLYLVDTTTYYVYLHANSTLPWYYRICAIWAGHEGSLLLWASIATFYFAYVMKLSRNLNERQQQTLHFAGGLYIFLVLLVITVTSNPFIKITDGLALDGVDLNPVLQDFALIIHPPILYLGYVGTFAVFASLAPLIVSTEHKEQILALSRKILFFSFGMLSLGITLGSWWAYYELGWGGWWFWDPAENIALMPWLMCVALIHSLYLARTNNKWLLWSIIVAGANVIVSLSGTFLLRSGLVGSVHTFALDLNKAKYLGLSTLLYLVFITASVYKNTININEESKSRYLKLIKVNNLSILSFTIAVFVATVYPLISPIVLNQEVTVGPAYYNLLAGLLVLPTLFLIPFTNFSLSLKQNILLFASALGVAASVKVFFGFQGYLSLLLLLLSFYILLAQVVQAVFSKRKNMYSSVSHAMVGLFLLAVTSVSYLEYETEVLLKPQGVVSIGKQDSRVSLSLDKTVVVDGDNYVGIKGTVGIREQGKLLTAFPEKRFYFHANAATTEVYVLAGIFKDYYVAMGDKRNDAWTIRYASKPMVRWLWLAGIVLFVLSTMQSTKIRVTGHLYEK